MNNSNYLIPIIFLSLFFVLEIFFAHHRYRQKRIRHTFLNIGISLINGSLLLLLAGIIFAADDKSLRILSGLGISGLALSIILFLLFDLWMYLWHRINHRISFFWRFHRMHHTDNKMDSTTALRFHPGEITMSSLLNSGVIFLFGITAPLLAFYKIIQNICVIFHHSNIALPEKIDRILRAIIVTPNMHRVHHSKIRKELDSNYSSLFSFWDRIFKSFQKRKDTYSVDYGVEGLNSRKWRNFKGMIKTPFLK